MVASSGTRALYTYFYFLLKLAPDISLMFIDELMPIITTNYLKPLSN